jgi:hypothetical protein
VKPAPHTRCQPGMSRHVHLAAFLATVAFVVPAGWRALDADIQSDGPAFRPWGQQLHVGDATVDVDLDRGVLLAGNKLKVTLKASADTPSDVALDVRALMDNGTGEERIPVPPTEVAHRRIRLQAAPGGGKPLELTFALDNATKGMVKWYDVEVTPAGQGSPALDARRNAVPRPITNMPETEVVAAKVGAAVWGGNTLPITIEAPPVLPSDGPFVLGVRVKNTTKTPLDMYTEMGTNASLFRTNLVPETTATPDFTVTLADDDSAAPIPPGGEHVYKYEITPMRDDVTSFTVMAYAVGTYAPADDSQVDTKAAPRAALTSHTFTRAKPTPTEPVTPAKPVVARK